jgi:hypothetical protein
MVLLIYIYNSVRGVYYPDAYHKGEKKGRANQMCRTTNLQTLILLNAILRGNLVQFCCMLCASNTSVSNTQEKVVHLLRLSFFVDFFSSRKQYSLQEGKSSPLQPVS